MTGEDTVLVTGGSGYIAGWCIARLLNDGFRVRTTVRDLAREAEVRRTLATLAPAASSDRLNFFAADLDRDEGWNEAAEGCRYVLHVASPVSLEARRDPEAIIRQARNGELRVFMAARDAGVQRIVMTSSISAVAGDAGAGRFDETRWTDLNAKGVGAYARSKTSAEREAWELVATAGPDMSLSTVLPVFVIGPAASADVSPSLVTVSRLMKGDLPGIANLGFSFVDVRDVADLHVRAMLAPEAAGERFIAASEFLWYGEVAATLRENLGAAAAKVPTRRLPDWLVRLIALFDRDVAAGIKLLSVRAEYSSEKSERLLGWKPRPARESILDCAKSLIDLKLV
jgi:dihydroflavonol-4-reductase